MSDGLEVGCHAVYRVESECVYFFPKMMHIYMYLSRLMWQKGLEAVSVHSCVYTVECWCV